ncbi:MAG: sugar phosphate isomerase/epimerase [Clostridiales bacterium]|nr:sugar phosphate isomerase/epimerase [Clostridiales bacterium]
MYQLGAQMFTLRDYTKTDEGFLECLKKIKKIGYKNVQVSGIGPDVTFEGAAEALKETGLFCAATHINFDNLLSDFDREVYRHKLWGCPYVGVGGLPARYISEEGYYQFAKDASEVTRKLKAEGLHFIYHNHHHEFAKYGDKIALDILFDNVCEDFQFELDVHWVVAGGGDPIWWIDKCGGRMDVIHFKDFTIHMPGRERRYAPIGEGNLNWDGIIAACERNNIKYILIEQDDCYGRDPFECLESSYKFLTGKGLK